MAYVKQKVPVKTVQKVEGADIWGIDIDAINKGTTLLVTDRATHQFHPTAEIVEYERAGQNIYVIDIEGNAYTNSDHYMRQFQQEIEQNRGGDFLRMVSDRLAETGKYPYKVAAYNMNQLMIERDGEFVPTSPNEARNEVRNNFRNGKETNLAFNCSMIDVKTGDVYEPQMYKFDSVTNFGLHSDGTLYLESASMILTNANIEQVVERATEIGMLQIEFDGSEVAQKVASEYGDSGKYIYSMLEYDSRMFMRFDRDSQQWYQVNDISEIQPGNMVALGDIEIFDVNNGQSGFANGRINTVEDVIRDGDAFAIVSRSAVFSNVSADELSQAIETERANQSISHNHGE